MSNAFDPNNPHHYATTKIVQGFTADPAALQKSMQYWHQKEAYYAAQERAEAEAQTRARAQAQAATAIAAAQPASNPQGQTAQQAAAAASGQNAA